MMGCIEVSWETLRHWRLTRLSKLRTRGFLGVFGGLVLLLANDFAGVAEERSVVSLGVRRRERSVAVEWWRGAKPLKWSER